MYEEEFFFNLQMLPYLKPAVSLKRQKTISTAYRLHLRSSVSQTPDLIMTAQFQVIHANLLWPSIKSCLRLALWVNSVSSGNSQAVALWKQAQRELWAVGFL